MSEKCRRRDTVILAAGDFPRKGGEAWRILVAAKRVVACDSAANAYRRRFRKWPTVIIGDMDSVKLPVAASANRQQPITNRQQPTTSNQQPTTILPDPDQETNDLEKAIACCAKRGWRSPVIVGATGKREDHMLGNVFRGLEHGLEIVTDYGRFLPLCGKLTLRLKKGTAISLFAPDPTTRMTSKGLEWPLDGVEFKNLYCATLNRASASIVTVTSTKPTYVYVGSLRGRGRF